MSASPATGSTGSIQATALAMLHPSLPVHIGVYLLPLRHPVLVARQLADIDRLAPGRLVFGVGVGGEDRHEVSICGVDPSTRGKRMNESLIVLRQLLTGTATTFHGRFFDIDEAVISPAPEAGIPIIIGGRSDEAVRRAGRLGDGWLGIWNSPRRFAEATEMAAAEAELAGRSDPPTRHAMQVWCGLADSKEAARACLAPAMQGVLPAAVRALRALLPVRHGGGRRGVPGALRRCRLPRVQPDPAVAGRRLVRGRGGRRAGPAGGSVRGLPGR